MQVRERWDVVQRELSALRRWSYVPPGGGFYTILRLNGNEEPLAEALLQREQILVHPGYFYDMEPDHLVLSFIQTPEVLRDAIPRLCKAESFE
jgi:aspartate/methionine/tyrosine aminotransferase